MSLTARGRMAMAGTGIRRTVSPPHARRSTLVALGVFLSVAACDSPARDWSSPPRLGGDASTTRDGDPSPPPDAGDAGSGGEDPAPRPEERLQGCTPVRAGRPPQEPVRLRFETEPGAPFFGRPFPDDSRLVPYPRPTGPAGQRRVDLGEFPNPRDNSSLASYLAVMGQHNSGFGKNGAFYLTFTGPLAPATLPHGPPATREAGASLYLEDVDVDSPHLGERIPLVLRYQEEATPFLPPFTVAALPLEGFTLRDATRYALVVTRKVGDAWCRPLAAAGPASPQAEALVAAGLDPEEVAGAAVFTTQDVIGPMRRLREAVRALPRPTIVWTSSERLHTLDRYDGIIAIPTFQEGSPPYLGSGGGIVWDADGKPVLQRTEEVAIALTVPARAAPAEGGWPLVLYSHGTGGSRESFIEEGLARDLGERGFAVLGFDQVLHGSRDPTHSDPEVTFFNVFNPLAGRDNPRQGGVDGFALFFAVENLVIEAADAVDGVPVRFDPDRILFLGHSQGGITGAPFVAAETGLRAAVFSGTGGILRFAVLERKDPVDIKAMVEQALGMRRGEELDPFHPVLTLLQMFIEPADPINYAPYILLQGERSTDFLMLEGMRDQAVPPGASEALAAAAGVDIVEPVGHRIPALDLLGREPLPPPVQGNVGGRTGGLLQYPRGDHFVLFDDGYDARDRVLDFLESALHGTAVIP